MGLPLMFILNTKLDIDQPTPNIYPGMRQLYHLHPPPPIIMICMTLDCYGRQHVHQNLLKTFMHTSGLSDCQYQHLVSVAELDKEFHHV